MTNRILSGLLTLVLLLALIPAAPASANTFKPITGWDMMKELGIGINIANTLDARAWGCEPEKGVVNECRNSVCPKGWGHCGAWNSCADRIANLCKTMCTRQQWDGLANNHMANETTWNQAKIEKWHFLAIKQKGFDHVRIPITWELHMDSNRRINQEWMARVQQCVDWALEAGLYVIINTHHERSTPQSLYNLSSHSFEGARDWLVDVWTQIAERFKDYPETLIFEPMNEPYPRATHGWFYDYDVFKNEIPPYAARVNQMNRAALDVIRKSGGNNDKRVVQLAVIQASSFLLQYYEPPPNDPYTMVGIFYYQDYKLEHIKPALDKGIPVYVKETGPIDMQTSGVMSNAVQWVREYIGLFASMGIPTAWWSSYAGGPPPAAKDPAGLQDRYTGEWNKTLVDAYFAAFGRTAGPDYAPPTELPYVLATSIKSGDFFYWTPPPREFAAAERMVVEFTGALTGDYTFAVPDPSWSEFRKGDSRMTEQAGRIIFDLRGVKTGARVGFASWDADFASRITRVYIDTLAGSTAGLSNFVKKSTYTPGKFTDVSSQWFAGTVGRAFEYGIITGNTETSFNPDGNLTGSEALTIGARIHAVYKYGSDTIIDSFERPGNRWFDKYILYAKAEGLIGNEFDAKMSTPVTRAEMVFAWSKILESKDMTTRNTVNSLPDVNANTQYRDAILLFYRAGIVGGVDDAGTFRPGANISRAEAAAIFMRLIDTGSRLTGRTFG